MLANRFGCALIPMLLCAAAAPAQVPLQWKFAKGQVFDAERVVSQNQTVESKGSSFKQNRQSSWHVRLEVQQLQADNWQLTAVLTKVEHQMPGVAAQDMIDPKLAQKMQGSTFTLVVTPSGRLVELKGYDDFLKKLAEKDDKRLKALQAAFPQAALKEAFADLFGPLPEKKVAKGDSWQRTAVEPISYFGLLRCTSRYVYEGKTGEHERIGYTMQTVYELPKEDLTGLFRIVKGDVKTDKAQGSMIFDAAGGRLVEHERTMFLRGSLTIESMGRRQALEFTSANEVKVRIKSK